MSYTASAQRGFVVAPHHLAAESGLAILREGGNAIEAMLATAATIAVVYPHMNGIGGDGFWLIKPPGGAPVAIRACGPTGMQVTGDLYAARGLTAIPARGALAANTVAGAVDGWRLAQDMAAHHGGRLPLSRLFEDAIHHATHGVAVTESQHRAALQKGPELFDCPGFARQFLDAGKAPAVHAILRQPRLAAAFHSLARDGLRSFYDGPLARMIAADLRAAGTPLLAADLASYSAARVTPLSLRLSVGTVYNLPPPTQGLASLAILGLYDRLPAHDGDSVAHVHGLVEATKRAFLMRDRVVTDPAHLPHDPLSDLASGHLDREAAKIDMTRALPWPHLAKAGDTVWLGAMDATGLAVSYIQSIFWEFGSGVVLGDSGILWQNRGSSFSLAPAHLNTLLPRRLPFHTLNPALAELADGRILSYGTMGGEGQPQTQAAVITRHVWHGQDLQQAVSAPRWLLGRTWGDGTMNLKMEASLAARLGDGLRATGHDITVVPDNSEMMGHAGAILRRPDGVMLAAADPRSDGKAAGF